MTTHHPPASHGGYTPEEMHSIVRRAHLERTQALREFFTWLFARHKTTAEQPKQPAHTDTVACG